MQGNGKRLIDPTKVTVEEWHDEDQIIRLHPDFRMWVLANRPGFPFLGNNFFREIGDVFASQYVAALGSCRVAVCEDYGSSRVYEAPKRGLVCVCVPDSAIENPDEESELALLTAYAPTVPVDILRRLCRAFAELRELVDRGVITYPYSTREAVAVAKHLEQFPNDGVTSVLVSAREYERDRERGSADGCGCCLHRKTYWRSTRMTRTFASSSRKYSLGASTVFVDSLVRQSVQV